VCVYLSLSLSLSLLLSFSLSHTHTHILTLSLSLSSFFSPSLSWDSFHFYPQKIFEGKLRHDRPTEGILTDLDSCRYKVFMCVIESLTCTATHSYYCNILATSCSTLQHTPAHCNAATHCSTLVPHCNTLQHVTIHCNTLQQSPMHSHGTATHRNTLSHTSRCSFVLFANVTWRAVLQCVTVRCSVFNTAFSQI